MNTLQETHIRINGHACRVWAKGSGEPLGYLAGVAGLPRWTPFLDKLAEQRRVVAPSLPGYQGAQGHDELNNHLDWLLATCDALTAGGPTAADLIGVSSGGALAADFAALWPDRVRRLVLISPLGIFDEKQPTADIFAHKPGKLGALLCRDESLFDALTAVPEGEDAVEWRVAQARTLEASARLLWPLADTGLRRRLARISAPTLLLWGKEDHVVPAQYAQQFARGISGPVRVGQIPRAGHLADWDAPDAVAETILDFLAEV
jgi:pimeloyl-ACP methyl ester carboxylesterase